MAQRPLPLYSDTRCERTTRMSEPDGGQAMVGRLYEALRRHSTVFLANLIAISVVTAYVLQRMTVVALVDVSALFGIQTNAGVADLNFSRSTMTILWPLVLGSFCRAFSIVAAKRRRVIDRLLALGESDESIYLDDLVTVDTHVPAVVRGVVRLMVWLPGVTIAMWVATVIAGAGVALAQSFGSPMLSLLMLFAVAVPGAAAFYLSLPFAGAVTKAWLNYPPLSGRRIRRPATVES
jgi:hypothetical protein